LFLQAHLFSLLQRIKKSLFLSRLVLYVQVLHMLLTLKPYRKM
jgi:hypothetical protein